MTPDERVEALAAVLRAADDEALVRTNFEQLTATYDESARALLASPALRDLLANGRAKALREAAEGLDDHTNCDCDPDYGTHLKQLATPKWLRERADREEQP